MTEIPTSQIDHDIENNVGRLAAITEDYTLGYALLKTGVEEYLTRATQAQSFALMGIRESACSFVSLRKPQVEVLMQMSQVLGLPLSPIGITTFTSGEFQNMQLALEGFCRQGYIGGVYHEPSIFKIGPSSRVGLWLTTSMSAADYTQQQYQQQIEHIRKQYEGQTNMPAPVIPKKIFSPSKLEMSTVTEFFTHEAFHATHTSFNLTAQQLPKFDKRLIAEALALRTGMLLKTRNASDIYNLLRHEYFSELDSNQERLVEEVVSIACHAVDAEYQSEITWRGILCTSAEEFLSPPPYLQELVIKTKERTRNRILPKYLSQLSGN